MSKKDTHGGILLMPPCALKKGAFTTPSEIHFFKKENGGSDVISKPPFRYVYTFDRANPSAK